MWGLRWVYFLFWVICRWLPVILAIVSCWLIIVTQPRYSLNAQLQMCHKSFNNPSCVYLLPVHYGAAGTCCFQPGVFYSKWWRQSEYISLRVKKTSTPLTFIFLVWLVNVYSFLKQTLIQELWWNDSQYFLTSLNMKKDTPRLHSVLRQVHCCPGGLSVIPDVLTGLILVICFEPFLHTAGIWQMFSTSAQQIISKVGHGTKLVSYPAVATFERQFCIFYFYFEENVAN